jgi:RNA polymerase sigma-70 factor (ECF subfamily)
MSSDLSAGWDELFAAARAGEGPARGRLLDGYGNYLRLLARVQIGPRLQGKADEHDLVQETFLIAHREFANFRGRTEAALLAWLRTILASRLAKLIRQYCGTDRRDIDLEVELSAGLDRSSAEIDARFGRGHDTPSAVARRRESAVIVADGLAGLPPDYREVLVLRHLEELTFPEIAARMGRSVDSVQKLWTRALPRLREVIGTCP